MLITEEYRSLNRQLHEARPDYGTSALKYVKQVTDLIAALDAQTILDYGCGKGLLGHALSHLLIDEYDPALPGKDAPPQPADLVCVIDVLEHIEPDCLESVLDDLRRVTLKGVFLTVATRPAVKVLADGRNAHLIVQSAEWWLPKIMARWSLRLFQATDGEFAAFAVPYSMIANGGGVVE